MNIFLYVLLFYLYLNNGVRAEDSHEAPPFQCNANITNMNNEAVNLTTYCLDTPCIAKCCGQNEVLLYIRRNEQPQCINIRTIDPKKINEPLDYSRLPIYKPNIQYTTQISEKIKTLHDFKLVQNYVPVNSSCGQLWRQIKDYKSYILENGQFAGDLGHKRTDRWRIKEPLSFCVEIMVAYNNKTGFYRSAYKTYSHVRVTYNNKSQLIFTGVAMLISSFFLILVLAVYCILPPLRNLSGLLLMAYVSMLLIAYILKIVHIFGPRIHMNVCQYFFSPIMYFSYESSFFWLNIMSFDIWWTFRGMRLKRTIHRQGELAKFLWYGLYAWGAPAAITLGAVLVDKTDENNLWPHIIKPRFETCFHEDKSNERWVYIPVGILTILNIVLFLMTVYNMWLIKRILNNFTSDSKNTKNDNTFTLYVRMSLLMGISWLLEVAQTFYKDDHLWLYILMNVYNTGIGAAIFVMFILNKMTYEKLCKRFNIKHGYGQKMAMSSSTKSTISRTRSAQKGSYSKTRSIDDAERNTCDVDMSEAPEGNFNRDAPKRTRM